MSDKQTSPASKTPNEPMLAALVRAGDEQKEAIKITDFIFMAKDISTTYLVTTEDGDVMINTGFMDTANVDRNRGLFASLRTGPLRYITLTQAHPDHYSDAVICAYGQLRAVGGIRSGVWASALHH